MNVPTQKPLFNNTRSNLDLTFRLARESDLLKLEWMGEYAHFRRVLRRTFEEQQNGERFMLVADFNDFPIGQIFLLPGGIRTFNHGYLYSLRVMQPFQGLGIGTALILQAEGMLHDQKLGYAMISVGKDNPDARRLYQKLNYTVYAEDEGRWTYHDQHGRAVTVRESCWMMEKKLLPGSLAQDMIE